MHRGLGGQITVFLALCSSIIVTVILAQIETARYVSITMMQRSAVMTACESMLAQYNIPLYEMYSIFGIDGNGRDLSKDMEKYVHVNSGTGLFEAKINGVCLTDLCSLLEEDYKPLIKEIVQYMKNAGYLYVVDDWLQKFADGEILDIQSDKNKINQQISKNEIISSEQKAAYEKIRDQQSQNQQSQNQGTRTDAADTSSVQVTDPREILTEILKGGLLRVVLPADFTLSDAKLDHDGNYEVYKQKNLDFTSSQSVKAQINQVSFDISHLAQTKSQDMLIYLYADQKFRNAIGNNDIDHETKLMYEIEYMICGHQSDSTNLLDIVNRLMMMRTVFNFTYLLTDSVKTSSAHSMAASIAAAAFMPWLEPVIYALLLVAWAYGEAMMDLRVLLAGGKVPLFKTRSGWQLSLDGISKLTENHGDVSINQTENGLAYHDYLMILWMMTSQGKKMQRMADVIEANIRLTENNAHFVLRECYYSIGCITEFSVKPLFWGFTGFSLGTVHVYQWSECY